MDFSWRCYKFEASSVFFLAKGSFVFNSELRIDD